MAGRLDRRFPRIAPPDTRDARALPRHTQGIAEGRHAFRENERMSEQANRAIARNERVPGGELVAYRKAEPSSRGRRAVPVASLEPEPARAGGPHVGKTN